jgi:hypothetical protein
MSAAATQFFKPDAVFAQNCGADPLVRAGCPRPAFLSKDQAPFVSWQDKGGRHTIHADVGKQALARHAYRAT